MAREIRLARSVSCHRVDTKSAVLIGQDQGPTSPASRIHVDMDSEPILNYNSLYVPPRGKIFHSQLSRCHLCQFFHRSEDLEKYFLNPRPVSVVGKVSKKDMNFSIL